MRNKPYTVCETNKAGVSDGVCEFYDCQRFDKHGIQQVVCVYPPNPDHPHRKKTHRPTSLQHAHSHWPTTKQHRLNQTPINVNTYCAHTSSACDATVAAAAAPSATPPTTVRKCDASHINNRRCWRCHIAYIAYINRIAHFCSQFSLRIHIVPHISHMGWQSRPHAQPSVPPAGW